MDHLQQKLHQAGTNPTDVKFSSQDVVKCECENMTYQQVYLIMRKSNPIIGQPALKAGIQKFQCTHCGKLLED